MKKSGAAQLKTTMLTLTMAKKIVTAEKFMRLIRQSDYVKSSDIKLRFDIDATRARGSVRRDLALRIEDDLAWYHMIAVRINLMNISAVTILIFWPG